MKIQLDGPPAAESQARRNTTRFESAIKSVKLITDNHAECVGVVLDESFGGIGLQFPVALSIEPGHELEISYNGVSVWAVARHISHDEQGGCRLGLEWKAAGLARKARQLKGIQAQLSGTAPDAAGAEQAQFLRLIPGGLYMMWRMFESERWYELGETADRLGREASACRVKHLKCHVHHLQDSLAQPSPKPHIRAALDRLIDECVRLVSGIAGTSSGTVGR